MAAVDDTLAGELISTATEFGMDCLVEIHDQEELSRALDLESSLIGINNRDLKTMRTDINTTLTLALQVPPPAALVSESGIKTPKNIESLRISGARRFLIGERLMRDKMREKAVTALKVAGTV